MFSLSIKDQGETDFCLACVISSNAEAITSVLCEESYLFAAGKKVSGEALDIYGVSRVNLITAVIEYGVLPKEYAPYSITTHDRDFLADWNNWVLMKNQAIKPFKSSFRVRGFDNAIRTMKELNTPLVCGLYWQAHWEESPIIDSLGEFNKLAPHEVLLVGERDGRIVIQNSRGTDVGDRGYWYLDKKAFRAVDHIYCLSQSPKKFWLLDLLENL